MRNQESTDVRPSELSPGVRDLVLWLNDQGYTTTDSGDGTNHLEGMECAVPFPMVVIRSPISFLTVSRLYQLLEQKGVDFNREGVKLELSYDPHDGIAVLILTGVLSADVNFTET